MVMSRRSFVKGAALGVAAAASLGREALSEEKQMPRIRLSACDWSLGAGGPGGLEVAKRCTLEVCPRRAWWTTRPTRSPP